MQEDEDITTGHSGTSVHLRCATAWSCHDPSVALRNSSCAVAASSIDDEQFTIMVSALACKPGELGIQHQLFVQHRHDDREAHEYLLSPNSLVSSAV